MPVSGDVVLATRDLHKTYGSGANAFEALKGITLEIREGESVAIVGKSGSGKSTLMHLLALLDRPTSGELLVAGKNASSLKDTDLNHLRNRTFGFVFQQFFMIPNASVLENVILPLKIAGVSSRERRERGIAALQQLDMADKAANRATNLSGGQKQRAVIARALVNSPKVIFADEPTGNLDTSTGKVVEDILFGLNREKGITLVIVTHDEEIAVRCDRQIRIKDGLIHDVTTHGHGHAEQTEDELDNGAEGSAASATAASAAPATAASAASSAEGVAQ